MAGRKGGIRGLEVQEKKRLLRKLHAPEKGSVLWSREEGEKGGGKRSCAQASRYKKKKATLGKGKGKRGFAEVSGREKKEGKTFLSSPLFLGGGKKKKFFFADKQRKGNVSAVRFAEEKEKNSIS